MFRYILTIVQENYLLLNHGRLQKTAPNEKHGFGKIAMTTTLGFFLSTICRVFDREKFAELTPRLSVRIESMDWLSKQQRVLGENLRVLGKTGV